MVQDEVIHPIKINFTVNDIKDFLNAKTLIFNLILTAPMIIVLIYLFLIRGLISFLSSSSFSLMLIILVVFILIDVHNFFILPRSIFKKNIIFREENIVTFTRQSIKIERQSGFQEFKWDYIHKIKENKKLFIMHDSRYTSFPIPKRCFRNEYEIDAVRNLFKNNLPKKKLKLLKRSYI